ncbi:MAG: adenylate/guanylate cyclase domain-containing protein [Pseudolabrys sp.]
MQPIADWLEKLGLSEYAQPFADNDIDFTILRDLTDQDLEKIGIASLGHRRKILRAIRNLEPIETRPPACAVEAPAVPLPLESAERRQVTVMFCDLVGSTALSARMDPEDLREVIAAYHRCAAEIVRRFGGFVAQYLGDGVLVYFGYPQAHEDDAERAVRAGLELIGELGELRTHAPLQARVGIATGLVVVGDLMDSGSAMERGIVGETPNLAARLQGIAEPDALVIAEGTRKLLGNLFELVDLGARDLKGIAGPVRAWAVMRASSIESRFDALHGADLTALVGRGEESELLLRRWTRAKNGEGQVVLLSGEAGIGKSRLTAALLERLAGEPHTRLRYFCSPQHSDSALYPIIRQMEGAAGLAHDDSPQARLDKLDALLAQTSTSAEDSALFAEMLSLANDGRYPVVELTPQQRRQRTLEALTAQIKALTRASPVLMIFEDAHWIDPTSLESLGRAVDQIRTMRVLLSVTFRPEFDPPWIGRPYVTALTINRLDQRDTDAMIDHLVVNKGLPANIRQDIIERADGIPLFVEEMTKAVLESEGEGEARRTDGAVSPPVLAVPASLQASLMARLDRLGPAKEVAQIGAAIGRQFSHALLSSVVHQPDAELESALDRLVAAGLLFRQGAPPDATYLFKHALVQDTAYGTLLRNQRQELHARIAKVLEQEFQGIIGTQPETLAHHFSQAGMVDLAIEFWGRAGARSADRSAHHEAVGHFGCALDVMGKLPPSHQRDERELELTLALAVSLIAVHGFGSIRVEECAVRAKKLSDKLSGSQNRFAAQRVAWNSSLMRQPVPRTAALARDLVGLAEEDGNPAKLAVAHRALGYSLLIAGEFREAAEILARGATLADTISEGEFAIYGEHPSMVCRAYGGQVRILMGFPESGMRLIKAAVAHARHRNNAHSLAWALCVAAHVSQSQHEPAATARFASEAIETAREHRLPQWLALGERCKGWAIHQLGDFEGGLNLLRQGVRRWYETGAALHTTHGEICLAESYLLQGDVAAARSHLSAAQAHCRSYGENYLAAEIDRLDALSLQCEGAPTEVVEECLAKALDAARPQGARLFELRSATALARIMAEHNEHKAVDILAPIYNCFSEGLSTSDLKEAKALLDRLM